MTITFQLPAKKMGDDLPTMIEERKRRNSLKKAQSMEQQQQNQNQEDVEITKFEGQIADSPGLPKK